MKKITYAMAAAAIAVAGCSPTTYSGFSHPSASRETASRDDTACSVEANQLFPAANFTTTVYGGFHGGYGGYAGGYWGGYPGYWGGSHVQMRDANASMRAEHRQDCMTLKGYTPVTHPICTEAQLNGQNYRPISGAPKPAPNICAIRAQSGGVALVDLNAPV
ncbi:hypothetical protein J7382_05020 [Shimia sp. R11_0]|uniref:Surface antigen n=1 Tax=Shimia marina TaxID=321267 RepID=A0A0P1ETG9_9RHOB|nr:MULTISPECIES: hypothetical protein [Shimia]MBO9476892.1 hypothetical protein [Shimia sp. R11_0]CUH53558.1 hypothetical protein SHM7688_03012 [Shimia marina]SFD74309.1 hypothetical protein SAMN04488037_102258 [Shimia marina]